MDAVERDWRSHLFLHNFRAVTLRRLALAALCTMLAACSSTTRHVAAKPIAAPEMYTVRASAEGVELRGFMQVIADTVARELDRTQCVRDPVNVSNLTLQYRCDPVGPLTNIVFVLDRHDPVQSSRWNATTMERTTRRMCTGMSIVGGKEVCTYQDVPTMTEKRVYGQLVVSREVAAAK